MAGGAAAVLGAAHKGYMVWVAIIVEATQSLMATSMCWPPRPFSMPNRQMAVDAAPLRPPSYCDWNPPCFRGARPWDPLMLMIIPMA